VPGPADLIGKLTNPYRLAASAKARTDLFRVRLRRRWTALRNPVREDDLRRALDRLMPGGTDSLLVHSSLSAIGGFPQGLDSIVRSLIDACETLVMPTHSYCYPASPEEDAPVFDAASTPAQTGALCDFFWRQAGVVRSIHATHSVAAKGPIATELCAGHYHASSPCGRSTPFLRLVDKGASALMFGVSFKFYTLFHTAEFDAESEYAYRHGARDRLRVIDEAGRLRECWSMRQNWEPTRYEEAGLLLERLGLVRRGALGIGHLLYCPDVTKVLEMMVERLRKRPDYLRASCTVEL